MEDQDAKDIKQMESQEVPEIPVVAKPPKLRLLWVVLACVVVGVVLGVVVYQQSTGSVPVATSTPRPAASAVTTVPSPVESPVVPRINAVGPITTGVNFPKAGKLRVFYHNMITANTIDVIIRGAVVGTATLPIESVGSTMAFVDTNYTLAGAASLKFDTYMGGNSSQLAVGWTNPVANKCGFNGFAVADVT